MVQAIIPLLLAPDSVCDPLNQSLGEQHHYDNILREIDPLNQWLGEQHHYDKSVREIEQKHMRLLLQHVFDEWQDTLNPWVQLHNAAFQSTIQQAR